MKKLAALLLLVLAVTALAAPAATAAPTLTQRVKTLETKLKALQTKANRLQTKVNALHTFTHDCLAADWAPLASYGDFEAPITFGYRWVQPDTSEILTSALDFAAPEDTSFFVPAIAPGCRTQVAPRVSSLRAEIMRFSRALPR